MRDKIIPGYFASNYSFTSLMNKSVYGEFRIDIIEGSRTVKGLNKLEVENLIYLTNGYMKWAKNNVDKI